MHAMTVQQPWATAIASGWKPIENRSACPWPVGQTIAIHAGGRWSNRGAHDERVVRALLTGRGVPEDEPDLDYMVARLVANGLPRQDGAAFPRGAVLGTVTLTGSHRDDRCCRPWGESLYAEGGGRIRTEVVHLQLADAIALPHPVPCPGQLGAWRLPADCYRAVRDQIQEAPA